ncbi:cobalt-precorrin-5B (C(1))-methyltransferase CbiD [Saccharicrinis fermentans]|uniref:Cobalt-precorrin-5B C(1)-methyltransferase n=3 Tax=Saccharicrinis fermentans TaxID=982 RepID=W7YHR9_9BACT|nr:cobalt-precorrin-5B (C(1))-methyltransferase CbiD [Saccharicrinis fermentans]GAF02094.1 precorrin-6A reductase [Saccharicrinis fermentans DSM 9555 = JCM 21142]
MVLVFGGTTEGMIVAELFDQIGQAYFYSTKSDVHQQIKGKRIFGAMNQEALNTFCEENNIRLIIDAAHPFAKELHHNIGCVAAARQIEVIRYERQYSSFASPLLRYFDSYEEMNNALLNSTYENILALTGVQTIERFKSVGESKRLYFRILDTALSREKAKASGIPSHYIIPMKPEGDKDGLVALSKELHAELLMSKESGESGFFEAKVQAACQLNIPLWVVRRPALPQFKQVANNPKGFLQLFYELKKSALKEEGVLRRGFTTGTCVAACAKACCIALMEGAFPAWVEVVLPGGEKVRLVIFSQELSEKSAACVVVKDAGDDADVTHAKEIGCELSISDIVGIHFQRGKGVGEVTLPGLQVQVGEPAINPVPRKMITDMLSQMIEEYRLAHGFAVKPFVPEGEELAKQTFNSRVGVLGGISILGTSGIVEPYSNKAFLESIRQQVRVAFESTCGEVVLTSGKRSENRLKETFSHLPSVAFIHFGNMVGETLKLSAKEGIDKINMA